MLIIKELINKYEQLYLHIKLIIRENTLFDLIQSIQNIRIIQNFK